MPSAGLPSSKKCLLRFLVRRQNKARQPSGSIISVRCSGKVTRQRQPARSVCRRHGGARAPRSKSSLAATLTARVAAPGPPPPAVPVLRPQTALVDKCLRAKLPERASRQ
ncbi:hypothetical protein RR48_03554 [Papilio machaon]|uniref:Uncharacterized protein n=1 Tax=Papilio machaon TaxID=76193 RepID=A0A0N1PIS4_PAPMA|nr:hypothetical protein RR48_03554 [Papilio machaon]